MVPFSALQSDMRSATNIASAIRSLNLNPAFLRGPPAPAVAFSYSYCLSPPSLRWRPAVNVRAFHVGGGAGSKDADVAEKVDNKPSMCTADELHYVTVPCSDWRLALWRYRPNPQAPPRNHPLMLLSGVGTNAIGYDLSPESSFARYMSGQGFDTWILEVRGAGLSMKAKDLKEAEQSAHIISEQIENSAESATNDRDPLQDPSSGIDPSGKAKSEAWTSDDEEIDEDAVIVTTVWDESELVRELTETLMLLSERLSGFLSEGQSKIMSAKFFDQISRLVENSQLLDRFNEIRDNLLRLLEERQNGLVAGQVKDLSERLVNVIEEGQNSVSPQIFELQERLSSTIADFQKQLDLIVKYDWDFDNYLEEDIPAVMEYIRTQTRPKDDRIFAVGHSMGGILLYALLSKCYHEGKDPKLAGVVTLASSLDYTTSDSTLKLLLPLADPAQALQVPVVPLGALLTAAYPLSSRPPYVFSWLNSMISAEDMMHPDLLKKLVLNNFCTIPVKLLIQLTTAFREGGLCNRNGTFFYKGHIHKTKVPVLALAGDRDSICPPEAVYETVKLIPDELVTYKVFGEPTGPHYAHYDLVGGRLAIEQIYPCIVEFLSTHDR